MDSEIIRIMDTSIANRFYTKHIYQKLIKNEADWNHFSEKEVLLNSKEMERLLQEIQIADHFLVPSQFVKDSLLYSGVDPKKIHIVPYGVDVSLFAFSNRRKNITEGKLELLFVGQCSYRKGINYLLEAADRLTEAINLTIAGGYQSIPELYAEYESKPNIHFLGRVNHERLPEVYAKADIFILPSLSEGMSQVGLEAMASGLPLLCSKNCGVNDVVIEEQNGWILDNFDTKSIIKKLEYINKRRKMISDMGKNARETALKYSWEEYNKKVNSIISEILNGGRLR